MKTAFISAYAWKNYRKSYLYHGMRLACNEPPSPDPFIEYPVTPPTPPYNFIYPCDGLPSTATPPMSPAGERGGTLWASDGLLHFQGSSYPGYGTVFRAFGWSFPALNHIEFSTIFANFRYIGYYTSTAQGSIYINSASSLNIRITRNYRYINGQVIVSSEHTKVIIQNNLIWTGPFNYAFTGSVIRDPATGISTIYLDGNYIGEYNIGTLRGLGFMLVTNSNASTFVDLDDLRAYCI